MFLPFFSSGFRFGVLLDQTLLIPRQGKGQVGFFGFTRRIGARKKKMKVNNKKEVNRDVSVACHDKPPHMNRKLFVENPMVKFTNALAKQSNESLFVAGRIYSYGLMIRN